MLEKSPFCKVDAGARLFFHEKAALSRPRARLDASTGPIKKNGARTHCGAEYGDLVLSTLYLDIWSILDLGPPPTPAAKHVRVKIQVSCVRELARARAGACESASASFFCFESFERKYRRGKNPIWRLGRFTTK